MPNDPPCTPPTGQDDHDSLEAKQRRFAARSSDLGRPPKASPLTRGFPVSRPLGHLPDTDLRKRDAE